MVVEIPVRSVTTQLSGFRPTSVAEPISDNGQQLRPKKDRRRHQGQAERSTTRTAFIARYRMTALIHNTRFEFTIIIASFTRGLSERKAENKQGWQKEKTTVDFLGEEGNVGASSLVVSSDSDAGIPKGAVRSASGFLCSLTLILIFCSFPFFPFHVSFSHSVSLTQPWVFVPFHEALSMTCTEGNNGQVG